MKKIIYTLVMLLFSVNLWAARATFEWDANTESDLEGYKIHWGKTSRLTDSEEPIDNWCRETYPDTVETCKSNWLQACDANDRACNHRFFTYENIIDVKNVTEFEVVGLPDGKLFFAASAYDTESNESSYSNELVITFNTMAPSAPLNFKVTVSDAIGITIEVE